MTPRKTAQIHSYYAVFDPAEEGGYNVSFPDFPGCVTFGRTLAEAKKMAREVLELWIEELRAQGERLPQASSREPRVEAIRVRA